MVMTMPPNISAVIGHENDYFPLEQLIRPPPGTQNEHARASPSSETRVRTRSEAAAAAPAQSPARTMT